MKRASPYVLLLWALAAGMAPAASIGYADRVTTYTASFELYGEVLVHVHNPFGDIRVRTTAEAKASIAAVIQPLTSNPNDITIVRETKADGVHVVVQDVTHSYRGRVDLSIVVPKPTPLKVIGKDGQVQAKGLSAPISISTRTGEIFVASAKPVQATTETGEIYLHLTSVAAADQSQLTTNTGDITVRFSGTVSPTVVGQTTGQTEFRGLAEGSEKTTGLAGNTKTFQLGKGPGIVNMKSQAGRLTVQIDRAPGGSTSPPHVIKKNLQELPRTQPWREGDPIIEVPKKTR